MGFYLQYFTDNNCGTLTTGRVKEARPLNRGSTGYQVSWVLRLTSEWRLSIVV